MDGRSSREYYFSMLPASPIITLIFLLIDAVAGMAIGIFSGWLTSFLTRTRSKGLLTDGLIGAGGFLAGLMGAVFMPWHRNTISYHLSGGTLVTSTANVYQHPERVAVIVAIVLPSLYELIRWRQLRRSGI